MTDQDYMTLFGVDTRDPNRRVHPIVSHQSEDERTELFLGCAPREIVTTYEVWARLWGWPWKRLGLWWDEEKALEGYRIARRNFMGYKGPATIAEVRAANQVLVDAIIADQQLQINPA